MSRTPDLLAGRHLPQARGMIVTDRKSTRLNSSQANISYAVFCLRSKGARRINVNLIQLSNLTNSFGDRVLRDDVTWQITDRERVGLCGPNGAVKTTLLRMTEVLPFPDAGAVLK